MDDTSAYAPNTDIFAAILCLLIRYQDPFAAEAEKLGTVRTVWETIRTLVSDPKYMPPYKFLLKHS